MRILQILPELNAGGVERGTLEVAAFLVREGHEALVVSNGGRQVAALDLFLDKCKSRVTRNYGAIEIEERADLGPVRQFQDFGNDILVRQHDDSPLDP